MYTTRERSTSHAAPVSYSLSGDVSSPATTYGLPVRTLCPAGARRLPTEFGNARYSAAAINSSSFAPTGQYSVMSADVTQRSVERS